MLVNSVGGGKGLCDVVSRVIGPNALRGVVVGTRRGYFSSGVRCANGFVPVLRRCIVVIHGSGPVLVPIVVTGGSRASVHSVPNTA